MSLYPVGGRTDKPRRRMSMRQRESVFGQFERWGFDQRGWTPRTRYQYSRKVRAADAWLARERHVNIVYARTKDLQAYLFATHPTATNRNHVRQALIAFGEFLMAQGWAESNPAASLPRLPTPPSVPKALSVEECRRIAMCARTLAPSDRTLVLVLLFAGLRRSEARCLQWQQVSPDGGWLRFAGKGGRIREVPTHPEVNVNLTVLRDLGLDPRWCFPSPRRHGHPVSDTYIRTLVAELGETIGIAGLHPHALRHSAATRLLERGVDVRVVQQYLGHASLATTQIYVKVRPANLREAVRRLDFTESGAAAE